MDHENNEISPFVFAVVFLLGMVLVILLFVGFADVLI